MKERETDKNLNHKQMSIQKTGRKSAIQHNYNSLIILEDGRGSEKGKTLKLEREVEQKRRKDREMEVERKRKIIKEIEREGKRNIEKKI